VVGFHVAGYNDKDSNWPWFVDFLGGGVFHSNSWPPLLRSSPSMIVHTRNKTLSRQFQIA